MNSVFIQQRLHQLKNNRLFEFFVIAIIIFSALVIGAKTYDIPPLAFTLIRWLDLFITLFFLVEISVRFFAEPSKREFFKSGWNIFDTLIVIVSLIPIEDGQMALLGRLIRIFRVLRMVSVIPELRVLLNSLIRALPQLGYVLLLMFIIFYIYAAIGATLFGSVNETLWGDISISLLTLFRVMTFEDWTDVMYETMTVYPLSWIFFLSFICLTAFAFLNMVIGVVVGVMDAEQKKAEQRLNPAPTNTEIFQELQELKRLIAQQQAANDASTLTRSSSPPP